MSKEVPKEVIQMLAENKRRWSVIRAKFNPISGEGSVGERVKVKIDDFPIKEQWLPITMLSIPLVKLIVGNNSIDKTLQNILNLPSLKSVKALPNYADEREKIIKQFIRIRSKHDFPFWCAYFVYIKNKGGGVDVRFRLNRPQRRLVAKLEKMRLAGKPIRLVILKARQWGGSTCTQMYMAWLQLVHKVGLNSLIIAHQAKASDKIKEMFKKMLDAYPVEYLHPINESYDAKEQKIVGIGNTGTQKIPQRHCTIDVGTAENPDSVRSGDYNLIHLSEVGIWKDTEKKKAEDIMRSACSGVLYEPYTMIVEESTANGMNFFQKEHKDAKNGDSQFDSLFVAWFDIELYSHDITDKIDEQDDTDAVTQFATWVYDNRNKKTAESVREEPGTYYWYLWNKGATLEALYWYMLERKKYKDHGEMASEYPSDDVEAFTFSGRRVFPEEDINQLERYCKPPVMVGEIYGKSDEGEDALKNVRIKEEKDGDLFVWNDVEKSEEVEVINRYLVVVDVCKGTTAKADYATITVFDRLNMMDADRPCVVAQWRGHIDMDKLAWKAAQVAHYYNDALLVIESNTLETNNTKGDAEYILNLIKEVYDNLYARKQSPEDIKEGAPRKYGFHTNVSTKKAIINNLKACIRDVLYIERDSRCLDEYRVYIENEKGAYEAMSGYHDDLLMGRAIGLHICFFEMEMPYIVQKKKAKKSMPQVVSAATI